MAQFSRYSVLENYIKLYKIPSTLASTSTPSICDCPSSSSLSPSDLYSSYNDNPYVFEFSSNPGSRSSSSSADPVTIEQAQTLTTETFVAGRSQYRIVYRKGPNKRKIFKPSLHSSSVNIEFKLDLVCLVNFICIVVTNRPGEAGAVLQTASSLIN